MVVKVSCDDISRELPYYIGGKLSVDSRAAIEEHFQGLQTLYRKTGRDWQCTAVSGRCSGL
jgi:hypothetical protein